MHRDEAGQKGRKQERVLSGPSETNLRQVVAGQDNNSFDEEQRFFGHMANIKSPLQGRTDSSTSLGMIGGK